MTRHSPRPRAENPSVKEGLAERLRELKAMLGEMPLLNPVMHLGFETSRNLEAGGIDLDQIEALIGELQQDGLAHRAQRLANLCGPMEEAGNLARIFALANSDAQDFDEFAALWNRPLLGCVFTGHPTFLLRDTVYRQLGDRAAGGGAIAIAGPVTAHDGLSLDDEHRLAVEALSAAATASDKIAGEILAVAQQRYPEQWRALCPTPYGFGTWVGYDMDGRTDIGWATSIRFRLSEKATMLCRYVDRLREIIAAGGPQGFCARLRDILNQLEAAKAHSDAMVAAFSAALDSPAELSAVANRLTAAHPDKLVSLAPILVAIDGLIKDAPDDLARQLILLKSMMRNQGLGVGVVHFRINAAQLHNAIRRRMEQSAEWSLADRQATARLREYIAAARPVPVNFAALAMETTTAIRQFIAMAQILKHIDADNPVRLLIAECEEPATVLVALYFARLFGIERHIDISPLFETESALEHGARFLGALLEVEEYREAVRRRGRLCIQTGFSDAGRFIGQIPAALAIERLQGRLAELIQRSGLAGVEALIFNTHGESMGRGAHPSSIEARLDHAFSPWARAQFGRRAIKLAAEISFQGGDGFVYFTNPTLALALLCRIVEALHAGRDRTEIDDPFYADIDISLDFYRAIRRYQAERLAAPDYHRSLTAFGLALLPPSGSRKSRRQSDIAGNQDRSLRKIRAIPHNAILQQLGYAVNVIAGIGTATSGDVDRFIDLYHRSPRAQGLVDLVRRSKALGSVKTLFAYGQIFDGAFWATRPYGGAEPHLAKPCQALAEKLAEDRRQAAFRKLATDLRVDSLKLQLLLDRLALPPVDAQREETQTILGVLHALRLCLMQHIFLLAMRIPPFAQRNDISRDDLMEMVFSLQVDDAVALLRSSYPIEAPSLADFRLTEPSGYPEDDAPEYAAIHSGFIDPIEKSYRLILEISIAIAHYYGAHG